MAGQGEGNSHEDRVKLKPIAIDLYCGLGGWAEGLLAEGWDVIGYDIERHDYGTGGYPGQLVLQDVLTLDGAQFRNASLIVASPPCQAYSYRAMPWKRAKALPPPDSSLFDACFRIQREACEAAGRHIPLIVENVCGAQKWVGRAKWHFGSFYLWGDVPALMPITLGRKAMKEGVAHRPNGETKFHGQKLPNGNCSPRMWSDREVARLADAPIKIPGQDWSRFSKTGEVSPHWKMESLKNNGGSWFNVAHNTESGKNKNPVTGTKQGGDRFGKNCETSMSRLYGSKSPNRKAVSAMIAKIPMPLALHIARVFKPCNVY